MIAWGNIRVKLTRYAVGLIRRVEDAWILHVRETFMDKFPFLLFVK